MIIKPQEGPQELFLSTPADIAIYGGAAGGGKSYSLLLEPIRHIGVKRFGAVIFRRNSTQIMSEGGLWDTAYELYPALHGEPFKTPTPRWIFPSGAKISFSHLQLEESVLAWQGSQITLLGFDELTHFDKSQFFYMMSRNRSTCGVKPYIRATCNPDADSWVASFISWWIDKDTGYPIQERSGKIRWMIRLDDVIHWGNTKEELIEQFELKGVDQAAPKSVTFISSKLTDNKILMMADPGYMANLQALPIVEKERLLNGNWKIRPAAGLIFPRSKSVIIYELPNDVIAWVRSWDMAATEDIKAGKKGDHGPAKTAGVLIGKRRCGRYIIANVINKAMSAADVRITIKNTAIIDKKKYKRVRIRLSQDPGQAGKDQAEQYIKLLSGFNVCAKRESGSKEIRAEGLAAQWQAGNVDIMNEEWTEEYLSQMDAFPKAFFKDMVDSSSNGFNEIEERNTIIPSSIAAAANRINRWKL